MPTQTKPHILREASGLPDTCGNEQPIEMFALQIHARCEWCNWDPKELYKLRWNHGDGDPELMRVYFRDLALDLPYTELVSHKTVESLQQYLEIEIAIARVKE